MEKCTYCNGYIPFMEMSSEEGLWYHDKCIKMRYLKRSTTLEAKIKTGQITIAEADEYKEIFQLLENMKRDYVNLKPADKHRLKNKIKISKSDHLISKPNHREACLRSNADEAQKRMEAARAERWAWEAMTMIEPQLTLSWKEQFRLAAGTA